MTKMKLNYRDQSDRVMYVTKTKQDNDMTDYIGAVYAENDIEPSGPIKPSAIFHDKWIRQRCDRLYKCDLCRKKKLSYHDRQDRVQFMTKMTQKNDMTNHPSAVYAENDIELLGLIRPGAVSHENQIRQ